MAEKVGTIVKAIQDAKSSSELVLHKLSGVLDQDRNLGICTCECHNPRREDEFDNLVDRVSTLDVRDRRQNDEIFQLKTSVHELREVVHLLKHERLNNSPTVHTKQDERHERLNNSPTVHTKQDDTRPYTSDKTNIKDNPINSEKQNASQRTEKRDTDNRLNVGYCAEDITSSVHSREDNGETHSTSTTADPPGTMGAACLDIQEEQTIQDESSNTQTKYKFTKPPNIPRNVKSPTTTTVRKYKTAPVIHQRTDRRTPRDMWNFLGAKEQNDGSLSEVQYLDGVHTVLLIDISESMVGAWSQVQTFVYDYLNKAAPHRKRLPVTSNTASKHTELDQFWPHRNAYGGLEELETTDGFREENVALVVYGHVTNVTRLTRDIQHIRRTFDSIILGGPTPMFGGVMLAVAAAESNSKPCILGIGKVVPSRIVLISDFYPTETELSAGPDVVDTSRQDETMANVLGVVEKFPRSGKELICVAVGEADTTLVEQLTNISDGRQWNYQEGRNFARRYFVIKQLMGGVSELSSDEWEPGPKGPVRKVKITVSGSLTSSKDPNMPTPRLSQEDLELFKEASADMERHTVIQLNKCDYLESNNASLPRLGSRVRRGPDWSYPDQDSFGPGTVVGHTGGESVHVEWDADGHTNRYVYGLRRLYDILLVDEPRVIGPSDYIAVGCVVLPGPGWRFDYMQVKQHETGVVIRIRAFRKVHVKWENGYRGDYTYKPNDQSSELKLSISEPAKPPLQTKMIKNKNLRTPKK